MYIGFILELDCGTTLFNRSSGVINLPRSPTNYLMTVNCTYTISTNQLSYIWLDTYHNTPTELLESFQDCDKEGLTVGCAHSFVDFKSKLRYTIFLLN